jgi:hypothetical protein
MVRVITVEETRKPYWQLFGSLRNGGERGSAGGVPTGESIQPLRWTGLPPDLPT